MKKTTLIILLCGVMVLVITGCGNTKKEEMNITSEEINHYIIDYFQNGNKNENYSYNYVDKENNIVIVGLIDDNKEKQDEFINDIFTKCCGDKYIAYIKENAMIRFEKGTILVDMSDIGKVIDIIISNGPQTSSNPFDYINASQKEYDNLLKNSKETFEYAISDLINSNANKGLKSYIEALLCSEINTNFKYDFESANDYLEHYKLFLNDNDSKLNNYDNYAKSLIKK